MLRSRKELLKGLLGKDSATRSEEPLKNIKDGMGSLSQVVGNPLFRAEVTLQINLQFTNGAMVPIAPAALPANAQIPIPVYIFGLMDLWSGHTNASRVCPTTDPPWQWIVSDIIDNPIFFFPGSFMNMGDGYIEYQDVATGNFAHVTIHCTNVAYGTFVHSFVSDLITVNQIRYFVPPANINQFLNPLIFTYQTLFGKLKTDSVDPRMYVLPTDPQQNIADIPLKFPVDKNLGCDFYMNFDCPAVTMILFVEKVQPLTLTYKK